ncbi:putative Ig domain-containing protein [Hyalangium versicolor]|uniref:putative Ig domain-containing protein n=1 Tax=Hyalangium versicolor TaxID=2861190 RepID=UPI001CCC0CB0|nr:putative Ig domain-containing protein [Hyalangium versicolor]
MSPRRVLAFLLFSTLLACPGGNPTPPEPQGPSLPTASLGESTVGAPFQHSIAASGGTAPLSYSAQGLPAGLTLDSSSGMLAGSPASAGNFEFDASVSDSAGRSDQHRYSLAVLEAPHFVTASLPPATMAVSYAARVEASGGKAPLVYRLQSGSLPPGLGIDASGTLSGIPSAAGSYAFELSATDAHGAMARASFTLEVRRDAPAFVTSTLRDGTVGLAYSETLQVSGGRSPFTFQVIDGALPAGLQLNGNAIEGTPTTVGTASFTLEVRDAANQSGTQAFTLHVSSSLAITSSALPDAYTGTPYSFTLSAAGGALPYQWGLVSGTLPAGLVLSTSGQLSGTPSTAGSKSFTVSVTDSNNATATQTLTVPVYAQPALAAVPAQTAYVADVINLVLSITGGKAPYSFSYAGALPPGLSLSASSGLLQGTLTGAGAFSFDVTASDANARTSTRTVSFTVHALPTITSSTLPEGDTSVSYSTQLTATGGRGSLSWSSSGTLPPGLSLSSTGTLSGTPTTAGSFFFTARVTDAGGKTDSRSLTLVIQGPPVIATASLADGYVASAYSATLVASGGRAPLSWSFTGTLPPGLSLSSSGGLSGTPTTTGSFAFTARVTDSLGRSASRSVDIAVYRLPSITSDALGDAYVSEPYSGLISASNGKPPLTFSIGSGALPAGLSLSASGELSGTPTSSGTSLVEVQVSDGNGRTATRAISLAVYTLPTLTTSSLTEAFQGAPYSQALTASGGRPDYSFSLDSGVPPAGITLSSSGILTGIPTGSGSTFTVRVLDANGRSNARTFTLSVSIAPHITTAFLPEATVGSPYSVTLGYSGQPPLSWGSSGTLPPGLAFNSNGSISGTPTTTGTWSFTVTLQDTQGAMDSRVFPLTVKAPPSSALFTVGQWNIEWFGSDINGPPRSSSGGGTSDDIQIAHARDVILNADADLWGLVEMVDSADFQTLKSQLPGYDGFLANDPRVTLGSSYYSTSEQKPGVLYDSRLSVQSATVILTSFDSDFGGRPPLRVDFTTSIHGATVPLTVIVLHMKAFDDQASYDRRQRASVALKNYIDSTLPSSRVFVIGDWNDDVDVSIAHDSNGIPLPTPYENFLAAPADYTFVTRPLSLAGETSTPEYSDMIDHTLATNELMVDAVPDSAEVLYLDWIPDYRGTTSDHYPVRHRYNFGAPPLAPAP